MNLRRRLVSIPGVIVAAAALLVLLPLWLPLAIVVDLVRGGWRLPITRLLLFGLCWAWLETVGVAVAALLWLCGQRRNHTAHYRLQAWWAVSLMACLQVTTGAKVMTKVDAIGPGPTVVLSRHASLADSLVSAWAIIHLARLRPRYVLKKELLWDPCLDVVGNRLPNHFLDRGATDSQPELDALRQLATDLGPGECVVIFPEGTRASPAKRERALESIRRSQPRRAERMEQLRHLLPPRPAGTMAVLDGAPAADVVLTWHSGLDGLDTFGGIVRHLRRRPAPVRLAARRIPRAEVPDGDARLDWLDTEWLRVDDATHELIEYDRTNVRPRKEWL